MIVLWQDVGIPAQRASLINTHVENPFPTVCLVLPHVIYTFKVHVLHYVWYSNIHMCNKLIAVV